MLDVVLFNMLRIFCLKIMDQNPKGLTSTMILSGLYCQGGLKDNQQKGLKQKTKQLIQVELK
jgi:hypothetical protein